MRDLRKNLHCVCANQTSAHENSLASLNAASMKFLNINFIILLGHLRTVSVTSSYQRTTLSQQRCFKMGIKTYVYRLGGEKNKFYIG